MEESCKGQRQMPKFIYSGIILKVETNKEENNFTF